MGSYKKTVTAQHDNGNKVATTIEITSERELPVINWEAMFQVLNGGMVDALAEKYSCYGFTGTVTLGIQLRSRGLVYDLEVSFIQNLPASSDGPSQEQIEHEFEHATAMLLDIIVGEYCEYDHAVEQDITLEEYRQQKLDAQSRRFLDALFSVIDDVASTPSDFMPGMPPHTTDDSSFDNKSTGRVGGEMPFGRGFLDNFF